MKAVRVPGLGEVDGIDYPGNYDIRTQDNGRTYLWLRCPGECRQVSALELVTADVKAANPSNHSWIWDGDEDSPTLTPSIHHPGCWHGWLRDGVLKEAR